KFSVLVQHDHGTLTAIEQVDILPGVDTHAGDVEGSVYPGRSRHAPSFHDLIDVLVVAGAYGQLSISSGVERSVRRTRNQPSDYRYLSDYSSFALGVQPILQLFGAHPDPAG